MRAECVCFSDQSVKMGDGLKTNHILLIFLLWTGSLMSALQSYTGFTGPGGWGSNQTGRWRGSCVGRLLIACVVSGWRISVSSGKRRLDLEGKPLGSWSSVCHFSWDQFSPCSSSLLSHSFISWVEISPQISGIMLFFNLASEGTHLFFLYNLAAVNQNN